jgi:hypothetical protein
MPEPKRRGRPAKDASERKINRSIRLSPEVWGLIERQAAAEGITTAGLVDRWARLALGFDSARQLAILSRHHGTTPDAQLGKLLGPWDVDEIPGASGPYPIPMPPIIIA